MLVAGVGRSGVAQSTDENLKKAVDMYTAFNIEGARPILLNIISPNYLLSVSTDQKVKALKYLGASYAVLDKRDSAVTFFTAALDYNPFTDLDPREFSAAELAAFSDARSEEHTSELQSRVDLVCRLLLEKKKGHLRRLAAVRKASRSTAASRRT